MLVSWSPACAVEQGSGTWAPACAVVQATDLSTPCVGPACAVDQAGRQVGSPSGQGGKLRGVPLDK